MQVFWAIVVWAVFGLIVGGTARLIVPGRRPGEAAVSIDSCRELDVAG